MASNFPLYNNLFIMVVQFYDPAPDYFSVLMFNYFYPSTSMYVKVTLHYTFPVRVLFS